MTGAATSPHGKDVRLTTGLLRFIGLIVAVGSLSLGIPMLAWSFEDHRAHVFVFVPLGALGLVLIPLAGRVARRIHQA